MRVPESLLLADRIAVALRWLALLGISMVFAWGGIVSLPVFLVLALAAVWNSTLTAQTIMRRRFPFHPHVCIAGDTLVMILLFYFSPAVAGVVLGAGLLPLLSAAFYFGIRGGIIQALANTLLAGLLTSGGDSVGELLTSVGISAFLYLGMGLLLGFASRQFGYHLRHRRMLELGHQQEAERKERERIKTLYNITSALSATLNYQRVLDLALDLSSSALGDSSDSNTLLVSAFLLYQGDQLHVGSARRFTSADLRATLPGTQGLLARAFDTGEPRAMREPGNDPELVRIVALRACKSAYCYPLRSGLDVYGALLYGHPEPEYFDDQRREILDIIGRQANVALQNARLYSELEEDRRRMMEIQEEAQKKLARNLHDGPTQSVAAIAMRVNFARRMIDRDIKAAAEELFKIEDLARRTTREIRHMLFTLRPLVLESSGLIPALESMAEKMKETYDQNVIIQADSLLVRKLEQGQQGVIFYIAEEAINNARKHAEASHIWVKLESADEDVVLLEVRDDGVGFNVGAVDLSYENRGSLGMVNMRERAELINGALRIDSQEGRGTRVRVWVPLTEKAAARIQHAA